MGGVNSGRWGDHRKATTVESCTPLDAGRIVHDTLELAGRVVRIEELPLPWGGVRRYWRCSCGRRVVRVYVVAGRLGCRSCLRLTYRSQQQADIRRDRLVRHPELLDAMLEKGWPMTHAEVWAMSEAMKRNPFEKWRGRTRRKKPGRS